MPKNCCVPLCKASASQNPKLGYRELPSKENRRNAWLRNIFRQGRDKGSQWQPSSNTTVCLLHFTANDCMVGIKRKLLLPTAMPIKFPSFTNLPVAVAFQGVKNCSVYRVMHPRKRAIQGKQR